MGPKFFGGVWLQGIDWYNCVPGLVKGDDKKEFPGQWLQEKLYSMVSSNCSLQWCPKIAKGNCDKEFPVAMVSKDCQG